MQVVGVIKIVNEISVIHLLFCIGSAIQRINIVAHPCAVCLKTHTHHSHEKTQEIPRSWQRA